MNDPISNHPVLNKLLNDINLQIISILRQGIIVYDQDLKYVLWNTFMEEITGLPSAEVLGKHPTELFPFLREQNNYGLLEQALTGAVVSAPQFAYYVPSTGKAGWASATYGPLRGVNDQVVGVIAVVEDITMRKLAEEALGQSELRYRNVVERATDVVYMLSTDGTIISLNRAFETITGWSRSEWIGKNFLGMVHSEDLPIAAELLGRALQGDSGGTCDVRLLSKRGDYLVGEFAATPHIENGTVTAVSGMVRDVTAKKRAQEALRQSENRFRTLAETASDAIITVEESGRITFINQAASRVFGYSQQEMLDGDLTMLVPSYMRNSLRAAFVRYLETGERQISWESIELPGLHKNGTEIPIELSFGEFTQDNRRYFTGIIRDVTNRKRAEEALRRAEEEYRSIFENALDGMFRSSPDGRFLLVNRALAEMLGYDSPEDLIESIGAIDRQFYADPDRREQYVRIMREQGFVQRFENLALCKDGRTIMISESGRAVRSSDGELLYYVGTIRKSPPTKDV